MSRQILSHLHRRLCLLVMIACLASLSLSQGEARAEGGPFYVAPWGSNTNPGTKARPWRTIQKALNTLAPGQTALVRRGTYQENATFSRSGSSSAPITLRAYSGERPVISGRLKITGAYFRVIRFVFRGSSLNAGSALIYVSGGDHILISRNVVRDGHMTGIYLGDTGNPSNHVKIIRNNIHDNGTHANQDHGIYYDNGADGLIANNIIAHNMARGIQLYENPKRILVTENTIVGNFTGIALGGEDASTADDNLIVNNIIVFNRRFGISTYWPSQVGSGNVARRNLLYGNRVRNLSTTGVAVSETIFRGPRFVDRRHRNYHLRYSSPAVNRAIPDYSEPYDYDGDLRPRGTAPDLGMDERR